MPGTRAATGQGRSRRATMGGDKRGGPRRTAGRGAAGDGEGKPVGGQRGRQRFHAAEPKGGRSPAAARRAAAKGGVA